MITGKSKLGSKVYRAAGAVHVNNLVVLKTSGGCSFYEIPKDDNSPIGRYISSTPKSRDLCNDPSIVGVNYTLALSRACSLVLHAFEKATGWESQEQNSVIINLLRSGLNFGLREALFDAFDWNEHSSVFVNSQQVSQGGESTQWCITESKHKQVVIPDEATIILGDVVTTGTSVFDTLRRVVELAREQRTSIKSILFFAIGSLRAEEILIDIDKSCRELFPSYQGANIIYFEGRFDVATPESNLESTSEIKNTGVDLLRSNALLSPEFFNSQYDDAAYPIQRCVIYDAGSRAFNIEEYYKDVREYWMKTLELANKGVTYSKLVDERFPELDVSRFRDPDLREVCFAQIKKFG